MCCNTHLPYTVLYFNFFFTMAAAITASPTSPRALLGPLTKSYTPPQICLTFAQASYGPTAWAGQGCSTGNPVDTSSCWPPAFVSAPAAPYYGWGFYSPGLICPSGYSSACSTALEKSGSSPSSFAQPFSFQFPLVPGETVVGCCPTYVVRSFDRAPNLFHTHCHIGAFRVL
jgi:hypothetical protein